LAYLLLYYLGTLNVKDKIVKLSKTESNTELSKLVNTCVYDRHGKFFGTIVEIILNLRNGSISHFVLEAEKDKALLPWKLLKFDHNKKAFALRKDFNAGEQQVPKKLSAIESTSKVAPKRNRSERLNENSIRRTQYFFAAGDRLH
jgi:sporulation protein YlmC with PRC-barrel domain